MAQLKVLQNMAGLRHENHGFTEAYGVFASSVAFEAPRDGMGLVGPAAQAG
jgi:hypothetical protein